MKRYISHIVILSSFFLIQVQVLAQNNEQLKRFLKSYQSLPTDSIKKRTNTLIDISWEYLYVNTDSALQYAELAVATCRKNRNNDQLTYANAIGMVGTVKDVKGDMQGALSDYILALSICKKIKDSVCIGRMNNNIGVLFFSQKEYEKSLPYFEKAFAIETAKKDTSEQIGSLINISISKKNLNITDTAAILLKQALALNSIYSDDYYLGTIYSNLGSHAYALNNLDTAMKYFEQAAAFFKTKNNQQNYGLALQNMASIYLKKGQIARSIETARNVRKIAEEGNYFFLKTETYEILYESNLASNNFDSAFYFKSLYENHKDSILLKENKEIVDDIEAKYNTAQQEKELLKNKVNLANEKRSSQFFKGLIILAGMILIFLTLFVYNKIKSNKTLASKNQIIESSLAEKEVLMREIHHRVKNNIQAIKSIINIQKRKTNNSEVKNSLNLTLNRVNAMSLIHDKLHKQNKVLAIDSEHYLNELANEVLLSFGFSESKNLVFNSTLCSYTFETDILLTLGLIVNELVTNACKYGANKKGDLKLIMVSQILDDNYHLLVRDYSELTTIPSEANFGNELIEALLHKLKGKINREVDHGLVIKIEIPLENA